jgi:hypothetical protein
MADAESAEADRPSFTSFWKRVKQKDKGGSEGDDQQKKKGKKSASNASPTSTGELQAQDEGDAEDQEEDQDLGEFLADAFPLLSLRSAGLFMLELLLNPLPVPLLQSSRGMIPFFSARGG